MPRAEVGSSKHLSNQMKSRGLQRLRWYCTPCGFQARDHNGFKCHCASERHLRAVIAIGDHTQKAVDNYSGQFLSDFILLLKTEHGTKSVKLNDQYQSYIRNRDHIHMSATEWPTLTVFGHHLGREGICAVEDGEKGMIIRWIDKSPEALRRQDAVRKKEALERGDEEREQRQITHQIRRAQREGVVAGAESAVSSSEKLNRTADTVKLSFIKAPAENIRQDAKDLNLEVASQGQVLGSSSLARAQSSGIKPVTSNVFASRPSSKVSRPALGPKPPKTLSNAEKIIRAELEAKPRIS